MSVIYQQVKKINMSGGDPVQIVGGTGIQVQQAGSTYTITNTAPLNTPPVERIKQSEVLTPTAKNIIVSTAATTPINIILPAASFFPVNPDIYYRFVIANFSDQDVTIEISDGSSFINSSQKVVLKANPTRPYKAFLNACNFPSSNGFPAISAWEKEAGVLCKFKARFTGSVPMNTFNTPTPIAFREGNETDNNTVFELDPADDTNILINASCNLQAAFDSTIDATGFSPTYNVELYVQITRGGAVLPIDPYTRIKTGNFGGEDAAITKVVDFDVFAGDQLKIIQHVTNNVGPSTQGNHIASNLFLKAFV
jgi:hypothetical protein